MKLRRPDRNIDLEVRELVVERLREQYPWMKIEAVHDLARKCLQTLSEGIEKQAPIMEASKAKLSFLSLSPELRNRIYELALIKGIQEGATECHVFIDVKEDGSDDAECREITGEQVWMQQPHLTAVCRQIRNETLPIYYGQNIFEANVDAYYSAQLLTYLCEDRDADTTTKILLKYIIFKKTFVWLSAIGDRNIGLIKRFNIRLGINRWHQEALFSSLLPNAGIIKTKLRRMFEHVFCITPPTTSVMVREAPIDTGTVEEYEDALEHPHRGWKELLLLSRSAVDSETS